MDCRPILVEATGLIDSRIPVALRFVLREGGTLRLDESQSCGVTDVIAAVYFEMPNIERLDHLQCAQPGVVHQPASKV